MILRFQLLACSVEISVEDAVLAERLRYLLNSAEQPMTPLHTFHYAVRGDGPYEIREEGDLLDHAADADAALAWLDQRCHLRTYDRLALAGWTLVRGAVANMDGRRLLIAGDSGTGKSTLALHLLLRHQAVEGDELAIVRPGEVIALPRRLRVKPGTLALLPQLEAMAAQLPRAPSDDEPIVALDPREAGYRWSLKSGPVDALVLAVANHGSGSGIREVEPVDALRRLLRQVFWFDDCATTRSRMVRSCGWLTTAELFELRLGDLDEAVRLLRSAGNAAARARG